MLVQPVPGHAERAIDFSDASETEVGKILRHAGIAGYEPDTLSAAIALVDAYHIDAFADIGANIGIYSLVLSAIFRERLSIDAFEPLPMLHEILVRLAKLNELPIRIHREALSDFCGKATFYVSARSDSSNSLNRRFRPAKDQIEVDVLTLDAFTARHGVQPRLIKIDTESTEPSVLRGALQFLSTVRPWIICEVLYNRTEEDIAKVMEPLGYAFYHLTGAPLDSPAALVGDASYVHRDWLLAPSAPSPLFNQRYAAWRRVFSSLSETNL